MKKVARATMVLMLVGVLITSAIAHGSTSTGRKRSGVYSLDSNDGALLWMEARSDADLVSFIDAYAVKGLAVGSSLVFDQTDQYRLYVVPLNDSPVIPQLRAGSSVTFASLPDKLTYLYFLRFNDRSDLPFMVFTLQWDLTEGERAFRIVLGENSIVYDSEFDALRAQRVSATDRVTIQSVDFGRLWGCLLSYLGISGGMDIFSLISNYCELEADFPQARAKIKEIAQMVNGCVNPLNLVNCVLGVSKFLACGIAEIMSCYAQGGASSWNEETVNWTVSYGNNWNRTGNIRKSGASKIKLYFSRINLEAGFDFLRSSTGDSWSGRFNSVWTREINGDTVALTLTSDSSVTGDFVVSKIAWQGNAGAATKTGSLFR